MIEVRQTQDYAEWFASLKDAKHKARIDARIRRLSLGNFGDAKFFDAIGELRMTFGPGFRVYFVKRGETIVILLCGGDKGSQRKDIEKAKRMAKEID